MRYQAGRFGSGFKPRPKSDAGIREIPLAPLVVEAIRSQLPPGADPDVLVFTGPGGGNHVAAGTRTVLSRHGVRRMYQTAVKRADLDHLQLRGPHDFRHTFSTWLEDAGIPARVIDELMGHQRSRHGDLDGGSRIGARYRHTTDEMAVRVVDAIEAPRRGDWWGGAGAPPQPHPHKPLWGGPPPPGGGGGWRGGSPPNPQPARRPGNDAAGSGGYGACGVRRF